MQAMPTTDETPPTLMRICGPKSVPTGGRLVVIVPVASAKTVLSVVL